MTITEIFTCMNLRSSYFKDENDEQFQGIVLEKVLQESDYDFTLNMNDKMVILKRGSFVFEEIDNSEVLFV